MTVEKKYPKIIGITGLPASGKTEAANFIKKRGIPSVNMGDVLRKEAPDLKNIGEYADYLRNKEGMDAIAKRCIPQIEKIINEECGNLKFILIEGIRNIEEVELFRSLTDDFVLINITADKIIRFERTLKRGREDASKDLENFEERDRREIGWGLEKVMKNADIVVINNSSLNELKDKIEDILQIFDL